MSLLMNNIHEKNFDITQLGKKLRHPGRALDLKAKDLIGLDQTLLFISQS